MSTGCASVRPLNLFIPLVAIRYTQTSNLTEVAKPDAKAVQIITTRSCAASRRRRGVNGPGIIPHAVSVYEILVLLYPT